MANRIEVKITWQDSSEGKKEEQQADVVELFISIGSKVKESEALALVESEKASVEIYAPVAGEVTEIMLKVGDRANYGSVLCVIEEK